MLLQSIRLKNFRGYEEFTLNLSPSQFTLIVGDNGIGKTAALEGIAVGLGAFLNGFHDIPTRHILPDEIHLKKFLKGSTAINEPQFPVMIECTGRMSTDEPVIAWTRSLNTPSGRTTRKDTIDITDYSKQLQIKVMQGTNVILPIIAYYGTQRLWSRETRIKRSELAELKSRTHAYLDCLTPTFNEKLFTQWFMDKKYISLEDGVDPGELKAVQKAIQTCLKDLEGLGSNESWNLEYNVKRKELQFTFSNGDTLPFTMLSDGYRNTIGLVADIAFRMASLNPHLEEHAVLETPGILLIDEIDLHLHPKWQRRIVDDLKRTFPKVQFIASTHSPFVVQSLEPGELRILKKHGRVIDEEIVTTDQELIPLQYADESIEDVIEYIMGIPLPQWSKRKKEMYDAANEYFHVLSTLEKPNISNEQVQLLKQKLDELSLPYTDNIAYYAFLQQKRLIVEEKRKD